MDRKINAYINEAKGNLFEFLVGQNVYQRSPESGDFSKTLSNDYSLYLSKLEEILICYDRELMTKLPHLAQQIVDFFDRKIQLQKVKNVILCGKHNIQKNKGEQDLELILDGLGTLFVSLKLLKSSSFINTKSAGILTFLEKYFDFEGEEKNLQQKLNQELRRSFNGLRDELYCLEKIPVKDQFISWKKLGYPVLPGKLNSNQKDILLSHYNRLSAQLFESIQTFKQLDESEFHKSLVKLAGLDNPHITQLHCYHDNHTFSHGIIFDQKKFHQYFVGYDLSFNQKSLISLKSKHIEMQIRLKPMNVFTDLSYKVNCSLRIDPRLGDL